MATMKKDPIKEAIDGLSCDSIECKPVNIDWREMAGAHVVLNAGRGGESHKDVIDYLDLDDETCPKCGERDVSDCATGDCDGDGKDSTAALHCGSCAHSWPDPRKCDGHVSTAEGPMMNYWYPLKLDDCKAAAAKLANSCLCVVEFRDGETGLALTGGGMDLSWEICEAFILLGYMPPAHFSDLPGMAGKKLDKRNRLIIAACIASNEVVKRWADSRIDRIKRTVAMLRKDARKKK